MARITVNRQEILKNRADSGDRPVWEIQQDGETKLVRSASLINARLVSGEGGRSVWIEAELENECPAFSTPTSA